MSTPGQSEALSTSSARSSQKCLPLIEAATKDLFRKNAFRITGLPVDATAREVSRHADKLKMFAELGQDPLTQDLAFALKPAPSLDEIREAIQKLKDPENRLIDEFFWFWPEEFGQNQSDPAIQALAKGDSKTAVEIWNTREEASKDNIVAVHNLALVNHLTALDQENQDVTKGIEPESLKKVTDCWEGALKRWNRLVDSDAFWDKVTARIRQINEPNLPTGFARRMRASLPEAMDKINAELAVAYAEVGKIDAARLHIGFLRGRAQPGGIEKIAELVLTPARNRLLEQTKSARDRGEKNPQEAANIVRELLKQSAQTQTLYDLFLGKDSESRNDLFDEVAAACNRLQIVYHEATRDEKTCIEILNAALAISTATDLRQQIGKNIGTLTGFIADKKLEPIYELLKKLQDSKEKPRKKLEQFNTTVITAVKAAIAGLQSDVEAQKNQLLDSVAIVLRGISLDAWNKDNDSATAVAANELAIKYASETQLKQRLQEDHATISKVSSLFGDAGFEHTRMKRGKYGGGLYVGLAFLLEIGLTGMLVMSFVKNIMQISTDDNAALFVVALAGTAIALLIFWNRRKCIEAFSSRFCSGAAQLSFMYVPVVALVYANYRGVKKLVDRREWEENQKNKLSRVGLALAGIVMALGALGIYMHNSSLNSSSDSSYTPESSTVDNNSSPAPATVPSTAAASVDNTPAPTAAAPVDYGSAPSYSVPSASVSALDTEKAVIDSTRGYLEIMGTQIETLGAEVDAERLTLDTSSQTAVDAFNEKVNKYNALLETNKIETADFNEMVERYNAKLKNESQ
jgi:hypothetical protein